VGNRGRSLVLRLVSHTELACRMLSAEVRKRRSWGEQTVDRTIELTVPDPDSKVPDPDSKFDGCAGARPIAGLGSIESRFREMSCCLNAACRICTRVQFSSHDRSSARFSSASGP
jgi:hypothetical protein